MLEGLLESLFAVFLQADRGFVVLKDARTGRLIPKAVKYRRANEQQTVRISRTIVNSVMNIKEAILSAGMPSRLAICRTMAIQWPGGVKVSIGSSDQKRAISFCSSVRLRPTS